LGLSSGERPGEHRLNYRQINSIEQLYCSHPALQACRTVLHGQLLSGGIVLQRGGEPVQLKPAFKHHLAEVWLPFAADVIDSFLKFGYVVVVYEADDGSMAQRSLKRRRGVKLETAREPVNLVPIVPQIDTYEVAYAMTGRAGYKRQYLVYGTAPSMAAKVDDEARIVVRQHPDSAGNINSPMATVFDLGSFVSALTELAMTAELTLARPRIWTQLQKDPRTSGLDPQSLFFDSESRGVAASADNADNAANMAALSQMAQMAKVINKLQTSSGAGSSEHDLNSFAGAGSGTVAQGKSSHVPPEVNVTLRTRPRVHYSLGYSRGRSLRRSSRCPRATRWPTLPARCRRRAATLRHCSGSPSSNSERPLVRRRSTLHRTPRHILSSNAHTRLQVSPPTSCFRAALPPSRRHSSRFSTRRCRNLLRSSTAS
jgi:hypothetical protein